MRLFVQEEVWPLKTVFRIAHGARTEARVVSVTLVEEDGTTGRGECVPYPRYGESPLSVIAQIEALRETIENGIDNQQLLDLMPPCAARNAIDCAIWHLNCKKSGKRIWELAGLPEPKPVQSAYTIVIDEHDKMVEAALEAKNYPLLKIKIGSYDDIDAIVEIGKVRNDANFIIDANESLDENGFKTLLSKTSHMNVDLIEQPFKVNEDGALRKIASPIAICADESFHSGRDIEKTVQQYDAVNVKLDKTGGFTEALAAIRAAQRAGQKNYDGLYGWNKSCYCTSRNIGKFG